MGCRYCSGKGIRRYYHDAGDHFGAGRAPNSEWRWEKCKCVGDTDLRCKYLSDEVSHPIFNKLGCESKDRPGGSCDYHPVHYGDCKWFEFMTP